MIKSKIALATIGRVASPVVGYIAKNAAAASANPKKTGERPKQSKTAAARGAVSFCVT